VPAADGGGGNHFAADIGLDRDDVVGALDAFVQGSERDRSRPEGDALGARSCRARRFVSPLPVRAERA
jgi:hypothetical protein